MKFLALNVDFDASSLDFLSSKKPAHEGIKERYSRKSRDEWLEIDWHFANWNCYRLLRVSWALANFLLLLIAIKNFCKKISNVLNV